MKAWVLPLLLAALAGSVRAQDPVADSVALEARVRAISATLRCPVCLNLSIADSPSELARDMRDVVRDHLRRGESEAEIRAFFEARYGDWVDMKPKARGFNLLVWLLPGAVVLGGGAAIVLAMRRWMAARPGGPVPAAPPPVSAEYLQKVRDELAKGDLD